MGRGRAEERTRTLPRLLPAVPAGGGLKEGEGWGGGRELAMAQARRKRLIQVE